MSIWSCLRVPWIGMLAVILLIGIVVGPAAGIHRASSNSLFHSLAKLDQQATGYTPAQIEAAYNISPLLARGVNGSGETIALIELDRFEATDLQQFDASNGLPAPALQETYVGGKPFHLADQGETTLDVEWAHALAPGASIHVYYLPSERVSAGGWKQLAEAVDLAVSGGASTISLSFSACKPTKGYVATQKALAGALARGASVFISSGDTGPLPGPTDQCGDNLSLGYPSSDPSVVSVGGTSLLLDSGDSTTATVTRFAGTEIAWELSGGGKGKPLPRPTWETAATLGSGRYRYGPDVAFIGDPRTGVEVLYRGTWLTAGGTSLGAPAWAAIWALVAQNAAKAGKAIGAAPAILYRTGNSPSYSQAFYDVTAGGNGRYSAGPGWDPVTGWGTPNAAGLATAVLQLGASTGQE